MTILQRKKEYDKFYLILFKIKDQVEITSTNLTPFSTICFFATLQLATVFGIFSSRSMFFNKICRVIAANIYDRNIKLHAKDNVSKVKNQITSKNIKISLVELQNGFHAQVSGKLKIYCSFKRSTQSAMQNLKATTNDFCILLLVLLVPLMK